MTVVILAKIISILYIIIFHYLYPLMTAVGNRKRNTIVIVVVDIFIVIIIIIIIYTYTVIFCIISNTTIRLVIATSE